MISEGMPRATATTAKARALIMIVSPSILPNVAAQKTQENLAAEA
jgi:hypothetical protein